MGSTTSVVVERVVPEERQSASHLTQGGQGCGVEGKWTKQPASSQTSSRPGLGISQKVKKSSVNTSCPGPAPFLAVKQPSLGLPHRLTYEAIFTLEGCLDQWCIKTGPASCFQTLLRGSLAWTVGGSRKLDSLLSTLLHCSNRRQEDGGPNVTNGMQHRSHHQHLPPVLRTTRAPGHPDAERIQTAGEKRAAKLSQEAEEG